MKLKTKELKNITILYVEDNEMVRDQTEKIFKKLFKKIYVCVDGLDGFRKYQENLDEIDVIVTDINMPRLDGLEMIKKINKLNDSIATIVTTAHTDSDKLLEAIDINIDKYITKPVQIKELTVAIVDLVLQYRRNNNIENLAKNLVQKTSQSDKENNELSFMVKMLKNQNMYLNSVIDSMVINFKTNKHGNITEVSNKFKEFFQYTDDIIGKNINILKCQNCEQESFQKMMLKAIHTKKIVIADFSFSTKNERKFDSKVTMTASYREEALVIGYTFYLDIL